MKMILNSLTFVIILTFSLASRIKDENDYFVKLVHDVQMRYQAPSVLIGMNNIYGYTKEAFTSLVFTRIFSNHDTFTNIITLDELTTAIDWYDERISEPFYVILIKSFEDFDQFINITKTRRINMYTSFVIFKSNNESLMSICKSPDKNYFNLVFNVKMLVMCQGEDVPLREWYAIFPNAVELTDYANWTYEGGLVKLITGSTFVRRNSLKGITLRVTSIKNNNNNETFKNGKRRPDYFSDVIKIVAKNSNFSIAFQEPENVYGIYDSVKKTWTGVVEKLITNKTDIGLGEFSLTNSRLNFIDFSIPIVISSSYYYIKRPDRNILLWSIFYNALSARDAYILLLIIFLAPLLVAYITTINIKVNNKMKKNHHYQQLIQDCYLDILSILCKMPLLNFSGLSSLRIAYFSLYILSFMLSSVYSAIVITFLKNVKPDLPFYSLDEFIEDGSYKITIIKDSNFAEAYVAHSNSTIINKLKEFLLPYEELPSYSSTALEQVCSNEKIVLFLDDYNVRSNQSNPSCELVPFSEGFLVTNAFAFQKDSPYIQFFNFNFQKMRTAGIFKILKDRYMRIVQLNQIYYEPFTLWNAMPIFAVWGSGVLLSLIILMFEKINFFVKGRPHEFAQSKTNYWKPLIRPP